MGHLPHIVATPLALKPVAFPMQPTVYSTIVIAWLKTTTARYIGLYQG